MVKASTTSLLAVDVGNTNTVLGLYEGGKLALKVVDASGNPVAVRSWASDNKSIIGADMDGYFRITLISPDSMEKCYVHNGTSPSGSIVATCQVMNRVKR